MGDYHKQILGIYNEYHRLITTVALRVNNDNQFAQEVLQDTMLRISQRSVLDRLAGIKNPEHKKNYILKIAKNIALDINRKNTEDGKVLSLEHLYGNVTYSGIWGKNSYDYNLETREKINLILECIDELPDMYRHILRLRALEELDTALIAKRCNISKETARKRLERARRLLTKKLEETDEFKGVCNKDKGY